MAPPTRYILPDAPRKDIVVNVAAMRLFYFPSGKHVVITHPVGIGRDGWVTPTGATTLIGKTKDPAWFVPASVRAEHAKWRDPWPAVVPQGPNNPLGKFELRLGLQGYLIHGANRRYGVGMRVSHGCMRLYPEGY
jgi:L,D-transpeptidase ErfK/SrfK